ncbi:uncharacterized protein E6C27_scaffold114G001620 [Cucumis melo var. makuwa]|uniref:Uncharacterized protein n=1 Tax=Cucumis melo var. makuwa TaxID=1194695 RepID=A0A5A7TZ15_CUCMM|nr:uncharacterized protein E6C27_scaffold114G001620 [Cucumis melo var. makuwa]
MVQSKRIWDVPEVEDTLCRVDVDPIVVKSLVVQHFIDNFINDDDEQLSPQMDQVTTSTIASFPSSFHELDDLFQELDISPHTGSLSVGYTSGHMSTPEMRSWRNMFTNMERFQSSSYQERKSQSFPMLFDPATTVGVAMRDTFLV